MAFATTCPGCGEVVSTTEQPWLMREQWSARTDAYPGRWWIIEDDETVVHRCEPGSFTPLI